MIDLVPQHLATIRRILAEHVPECEVRVFGSRIGSQAKPYSDLDLALVGSEQLSVGRMGRLREALQDSDVSIRVDILDWHAISDNFRKVIEAKYEVLDLRVDEADPRRPAGT